MLRLWIFCRRCKRELGALVLTYIFLLIIAVLMPAGAWAQQATGNGSATIMWGTTSGAGAAFGDSLNMHAWGGVVAGQANAAQAGLLVGGMGSSISVYSIGVQNITQVNGNDNTTVTDQNGQNNGNITTKGKISQ